jgi:hypothetical protein
LIAIALIASWCNGRSKYNTFRLVLQGKSLR